ncbi:MAG: hypothetical protein MPJ83_02310 [Gammaproteobacteria bacterium]|nr:hypothetical protein [Gammaproteobacteria bacterium]
MNEDRKPSFSERMGIVEAEPLQVKKLGSAVRNRLWNTVLRKFGDEDFFGGRSNLYLPHHFAETVWADFLAKPIDEFHGETSFVQKLIVHEHEESFLVFEFLEFILDNWKSLDAQAGREDSGSEKSRFIKECNASLAKENAGYRIVGDLVTPTVSELDVQTISSAVHGRFGLAGGHIKKALALFANRENPDYANSMKESVMAVESISLELTNQKNIKAALDTLVRNGKLHPAFAGGIGKLFNFASDESGVRHASNREPINTDQNTARFMLVTCSAFVNYMAAEHPDTEPRRAPK